MVTSADNAALRAVESRLNRRTEFPALLSTEEQDEWMEREEVDSALAGLLNTALNGGRLDPQEVKEVRDTLVRVGTNQDRDASVEACEILMTRAEC